jgi:hypothetical protein
MRLARTVSKAPPMICTPVPMAVFSGVVGTFGLLLPAIRLCSMIMQDLVALPGQRPSCGGGASSLLSELGASPVRLWSNIESRITRCPPALVPE